MLITHEKQVLRMIQGVLHLIERKKPNSRIGMEFVKTSLPYIIRKNEYGGYWILNREYKPLGITSMFGTGESFVNYEEYQCQLDSTRGIQQAYGEQFHFYRGSELTTASGWRDYLKKLDCLIDTLKQHTSTIEGLRKQLLGLDKQFVSLDGPINLGKKRKLE